jgi:Xaa-Pro aminopeptidase
MMPEMKEKHERVCAYLDARDLDGVVLTRRCNFSWYTCGSRNHVGEACDVGVSSLVVSRDGPAVVASNIEATRLAAEDLVCDIELIVYPYHEPQARPAALKTAMGHGRFAADVPLENLELPLVDAAFDRLRWQLTAQEIDRYRGVCRDVAVSVESVARRAAPGMTEWALVGQLAAELRSRGCTPWVLLVGADERIARHRHPLPTDMRAHNQAMLVTTAERGGLLAAVTRLVAFGKIPEDLAHRHRAVATVDAALIASTRPGVRLGELFTVAQRAYAESGFPEEWKYHHQGGSIGYLPREVKAAPGCEIRALADQAFAWNPSIAGTKSEDTILCREEACEVLTDTGQWSFLQACWGGRAFRRPDILIL